MRERVARLDIRTTENAKATLDDAAKYLGVTLSSFVLSAAVEKATQILQQAQTIHLTAEEGKRFLEALDQPPEANENLQKLFKKYQPPKK